MNWDRIAGSWKQVKRFVRRRNAKRAEAKQLAEWLAREHKADPIHK